MGGGWDWGQQMECHYYKTIVKETVMVMTTRLIHPWCRVTTTDSKTMMNNGLMAM
jgi:hypothetical protein